MYIIIVLACSRQRRKEVVAILGIYVMMDFHAARVSGIFMLLLEWSTRLE